MNLLVVQHDLVLHLELIALFNQHAYDFPECNSEAIPQLVLVLAFEHFKAYSSFWVSYELEFVDVLVN